MSRLQNKIICVTSNEQGSKDFERLTGFGARVFYIPTIITVQVANYQLFDSVLNEITSFNYLIFTSANSVEFFSMRLAQLGRQIDYNKLKVACVGNRTAESCLQHNIPVSITPRLFNAAALADEFNRLNIKNNKIFIPCSSIAREELKAELERMGNEVCLIPIYDTKLPPEEEIFGIRETVTNNHIDLIAFTSPSSYSNFRAIMNIQRPEDFFNNIVIAAIGNTTKDSIAETGIKVDILPEESSLQGLAESIIKYFN